jgi:hypothetical protein
MQSMRTTNTDLQPLLLVLQAQQFQPIAVRPPSSPTLYARYNETLILTQTQHLPVRYIGTMPLTTGQQIYPGQQYDWALMSAHNDPLMQDKDGYPMPKRVINVLNRIHRAGLEFDDIYIAHELPKGIVQPGQPVTAAMLMPPPSRRMVQLSNRLGNLSSALWSVAAFPLFALGKVAEAAATVSVGLDPIVMGVVVGKNRPVQPGEPAAWFYLTHWAYNEEA